MFLYVNIGVSELVCWQYLLRFFANISFTNFVVFLFPSCVYKYIYLHERLNGSISYIIGKSKGLGNDGISTREVTILVEMILTTRVNATQRRGVNIWQMFEQ